MGGREAHEPWTSRETQAKQEGETRKEKGLRSGEHVTARSLTLDASIICIARLVRWIGS